MFIDVLVFLAVAKFAVMLLEDASYAVRGQKSPRMRERDRRRQEDAAGGPPPPTSGAGRVRSAVGGYLAGLLEDATEKARARRRRRDARSRSDTAVDGVLVDVDDEGRWYADCDLCDWSSRPYRIENNARAAGAEHTRTAHPELHPELHPEQDKEEPQEPQPANTDTTDEDDQAPPRPKLRVIPGGADDDPDRDEPASGPTQDVVHTDDHTYCLEPGCPTCRPPQHGWHCPTCGTRREGFASEAEAKADAAGHPCIPRERQDPAAANGRPATDDLNTAGEDLNPTRRSADQAAEQDRAAWRRCVYPVPDNPNGMCGAEIKDLPPWLEPTDKEHCAFHAMVTQYPYTWSCDACGAGKGRGFRTQAEAEADAAKHTCPTDQNTSTDTTKETKTVNLEAVGPEEIRAAFATAIDTANERAEEIAGVAGVLTEAADRYESLQMAGSTVGHLRDAAEAAAAAQASLATATEELQAALSDFNTHDGAVADTVADTGGNVADREVLVG